MIRVLMPTPIGHALAGAAAAWTADLVPGRRAWRTAPPSASWYRRAGDGLTLVCAALAASPDLDLFFVHFHRTVTHSVTAVAVVGLVTAAIAARGPGPTARVAVMCAGAYATHLLLDWLATDEFLPKGIQVFWPFSHAWYISGCNVFTQTERVDLRSAYAIRQNVAAVAQEIAILAPIAAAVWLVRVKALARLPSEMPGGYHPPK
jgi:membrane-bound metal-dependent hydrolase YbcI (DUF457 family)